jgi:hypothetical protein
MMLEMAEFYDRLAELARDFKTAEGSRVAQRRERSKVPGGVVRPRVGAKRTVHRAQATGECAADG